MTTALVSTEGNEPACPSSLSRKAQGNDLAQSLHAQSLPPDSSGGSTPPSSTAEGEEARAETKAEKTAYLIEEATGWGRHKGQDEPFLFLPSISTVNTPGEI